MLQPAQRLPILVPGDGGWGGAPGITEEFQEGTRAQGQLCRWVRIFHVGRVYKTLVWAEGAVPECWELGSTPLPASRVLMAQGHK